MDTRYTFTQSAVYLQVEAALKRAPASAYDLAKIIPTNPRHIQRITKFMRDNKLVHVKRWDRGQSGSPRPVLTWGPGRDARRPEPKPRNEISRDYRKRLRAKYGEETKHIIRAQHNPIPGLRIVLAGKVVYQQ